MIPAACTILLIEDHPIVRDGCRAILSRRAEFRLVEARSAGEGLAMSEIEKPELILLDIELGDANGLDMMGKFIELNQAAKIIIFSMYENPHFIARAMERGARGYVAKSDEPGLILEALDKVRNGDIFLSSKAAQAVALAHLSPKTNPLTELNERERQVLQLLGDGKNLTEISQNLSIAYKSAANIVSAIKQKLQISTSPALIKFAVESRSKD